MSFALINKMTTKPGKRDEVLRIMLEAGVAFNDNQNCLLFLMSKDKNDENVLWSQDVWTDEASHQNAMADEVMRRYVRQAMPLLQAMPEQISVEPVGGKCSFLD